MSWADLPEIHVNGERVTLTYGPASSVALTYAAPYRRLPRLTIRRNERYWACRWTSQNDSYLECEAVTRRSAIRQTVRWALDQHWPIVIPPPTRKPTA